MKNYKKITLCVLTTLLVGSSQTQYVAAATVQDHTNVNEASKTVQRSSQTASVTIIKEIPALQFDLGIQMEQV